MIKFFRKIRQKLLSEGKTGKYLKYAIGEIVLVVIGILIALQINNWNEDNKQDIAIQQALTEVHNNLANDSLQMTRIIDRLDSELKVQQEIIDALEDEKTLDSSFSDNLGSCMTINLIQVAKNGYQKLQSLGLESIRSQNLENLLIKYYDVDSKNMEREVSDDNIDLMNVWLPYVRENFKDYKYRNYGIPKSYDKLSKDSEFLVMLKININNREATMEELTKMQETMRTLIEKIESKK